MVVQGRGAPDSRSLSCKTFRGKLLASLIREGKTFQIPSIMQTSKRQGMQSMNDSLFQFVKAGLVEPREAWMKASDKNGLLGLFKSSGIAVDFASG